LARFGLALAVSAVISSFVVPVAAATPGHAGDAPSGKTGGRTVVVVSVNSAGQSNLARPATLAPLLAPSSPYTECPAVGSDTSCEFLINPTDSGVSVLRDQNQGPFDGSDDTLVGVLNSSSRTVVSLSLASNQPIFGFDGDGLCTFSNSPSGCPFGTSGYEGPGTSFSNVNGGQTQGVVSFTNGLAPGATAYFSLEGQVPQVVAAPPLNNPKGCTGFGTGNCAVHNPACTKTKYPVSCASGDFSHTFTDVQVRGRGPGLALTRTYNSLSAATKGIFGYGWSSSYDMHLVVNGDGTVTVTAEDGSQAIATPNGSGGFTLPTSASSTLTQNGNGTWSFVRHQTSTFIFNVSGQLTALSDPNGYVTTLAYNGSGQLATITDQAGRVMTLAYGTNGLVSTATDPDGQITTYGYDTNGNLTGVTDPMSRVTASTYDANHLMLTMTDPRGGVVTNVYDTSSRVTSQTDPAGLVTRFAYSGDNYSATGGSTTITDPHGNVEVEDYFYGAPTIVTKGASSSSPSTWTYFYDPNTLGTTQVTDPDNHTTAYTYDANGNQTSVTDAIGHATTTTYNQFNEPLVITDPMGITATDTYDGSGNLLTNTTNGTNASGSDLSGCPAGYCSAAATYTYGDSSHPGDLTKLTDPDGHVTTHTYDANGDNVSTSTSPSSGVSDTTTDVYDVLGRKVCEGSPNATAIGINCPAAGSPRVTGTSTWAYDPDSEIISSVDPLANTTTNTYDADGNLTKTVAPAGDVTATTYDADNRTVAVRNGTGSSISTTTTGYDISPGTGSCSNTVAGATYCSTSTSPLGAVTVSYFNAIDLQVDEAQPAAGTTTTTYDRAGNMISRATPGGATTYTYDADNRPLSTTCTATAGFAATPNVSYAYDADGRRTQMIDGTGTTTYTYDNLGRLSASTNGAGSRVTYANDADGNVTITGYPGTLNVTDTYDSAGEMASVNDGKGNTTTFTYDHSGNTTAETLPNGTTSASSFDATNQMTGTSSAPTSNPSSPFATNTYTRNADGQVATETDTGLPAPTSNTYGYNTQSQLASDSIGPYTYDTGGELVTMPNGTTQSFNTAGQLTSSMPSGGSSTTYSSDAQGNRTNTTAPGSITSSFSHDQNNQLTSTSTVSPTVTTQVSAGYDQTLALRNDGTVWAWGNNGSGQLGNGTTTSSLIPVQVKNLTNVIAVSAGYQYSAALESDGTVWTWGNNAYATLGNGTTTNSNVPVQVSGLTGVTQISAGGFTMAALKSNGSVVDWGDNIYGTLGNNSTTSSSTPVAVSGLTGVTSISTGFWFFESAVTSTGTLWTWGDNTYSELGIGTRTPPVTYSKVPIQVTSLSNMKSVSAGGLHMLALSNTGTVWAWGDNSKGQLGQPSNVANSNVPLQVSGISNPTAISAGTYSSYALTSTGPEAWGTNANGELDNGGTAQQNSPIAMAGTSGATQISGGATHVAILTTPGTVETVGGNGSGQLGNGSTTDSHVPVAVSGWNAINSGTPSNATYAYNGDGLRMGMTTSKGAQAFVWNTTMSNPEVLSDGILAFVYGPSGQVIEQIDASGTPTYLLQDQLGSTRATTNSAGQVTGSYTYNAEGVVVNHAGVGMTPIGFAGAYTDPTGLLYLVHRYYDPATAQFVSADPLVDVTGQPYSYAGDNPVNAIDPIGLGECNSNPFSESFWTRGNCLSGAVGGANGGGRESFAGIVKTVGILAAISGLAVYGGAAVYGIGTAYLAAVSIGSAGAAAEAASGSLFAIGFPVDALVVGLTFAATALFPPGLALAGIWWLAQPSGAATGNNSGCQKH
jgi:RHS repeat-associated protein